MVKNTGIVPNGLVKVKNEVKHKSAKGIIVSIDLILGFTFIKNDANV